nr:hypothetical protein JVH1_0491 [Rhodococcus sp. JVH1]
MVVELLFEAEGLLEELLHNFTERLRACCSRRPPVAERYRHLT